MITRETYLAYYNAIEAGGDMAAMAVEVFYNSFGKNNKYSRAKVEGIYKRLCEFYGKACAEAARDFYLKMREDANIMDEYAAETYVETMEQAEAVIAKAEASGDPAKYMAQYASQFARKQASRTITRNARYDPARPKCMRIAKPNACGYCRMLASLGAWYSTKQTAANANIHDNCHCAIVVEFSDAPKLEGYSYDEFVEQYKVAKDQMGSTRRQDIIAQMDKNAHRVHLSADEIAARAQRRAERAAKKAAN